MRVNKSGRMFYRNIAERRIYVFSFHGSGLARNRLHAKAEYIGSGGRAWTAFFGLSAAAVALAELEEYY
jgi:hypothetical protein